MNRAEIERLAAATVKLRPDWHYLSLVTFLTKNAGDEPLWDAARKLVWIATEPGLHDGEYVNDTPRLFTEAGPWTAALIPPATQDATPVPLGWCSLHRCEDSTRNPCQLCRIDHANALHDADQIRAIRAAARAKAEHQVTPEDFPDLHLKEGAADADA